MKVPFGDLKIHYQAYQNELDAAVKRVLQSGHFVLGSELTNFESQFADYLGAKYVVGCASGTEAIYLALAACGVGQDDEVIVVAHTAVPTISAISMTGATPVFADIDSDSYVMNVEAVESLITKKTKAIVPVHLYGQMVDMKPLLDIASRAKLKVIEDVAQATGATYNGPQAGTLGDFGAFSFYPSKNLGAFGDGGAVSTNSQESWERLMKLRNYGQSQRYHHDIVGINSRLDEIQAAILAAQLPYVSQWNLRRRQIAARYTQELQEYVVTPHELAHGLHVYHLYVIQSERRDQLQAFLAQRGIQTLIHYPIPAHRQKAYAYLGYAEGSLPHTERIASRILSLPMFPELTEEQIDLVVEAVKEFHESSTTVADPELVGRTRKPDLSTRAR